MNASESDSSMSKTKPGESGEDELTRFFAETSATDAKHKTAAAVPVKGSILNFFKPPTQKKESSSNEAAAACRGSPAVQPRQTSEPIKSFMSAKPKSAPRKPVEWTCKTCTFDNSRQACTGGWLACEMCGECYVEEEPESIQAEVTASLPAPRSLKSDDQKVKDNVINLCGIEEQRKRPASSEVIVLDLDESDTEDAVTPRVSKKARQSSSSDSRSDAIEIDNDHGPRKQSRNSEVSIFDVDASVSQSVVTPASQPRKRATPPSILNFLVSKNSGRVSVYFATTGDSLHYNFDIDLLVTEETADTLLNAEVKRSSPKARAVGVSEKVIKFREDAVKQGTSFL